MPLFYAKGGIKMKYEQMTIEALLAEASPVIKEEKKALPVCDFGHKIGGARKDLYGLFAAKALDEASDEELDAVSKTALWTIGKVKELREQGIPDDVIYLRNIVWDAVKEKPCHTACSKRDNRHDKSWPTRRWNRYGNELFVSTIIHLKEATEAVDSIESTSGLLEMLQGFLCKDENYIVFKQRKSKVDNAPLWHLVDLVSHPDKLVEEMTDTCFFGNKEEKAQAKARRRFVVYAVRDGKVEDAEEPYLYPSCIEGYEIDGKSMFKRRCKTSKILEAGTYCVCDIEDWRHHFLREVNLDLDDAKEWVATEGVKLLSSSKGGSSSKSGKETFCEKTLEKLREEGFEPSSNVTGDDYIKDFAFYGGEFGNWLNQKERQKNLDMGYDAFSNLAKALGIEKKDVSLGGELSIAFGSRGKGGANAALAHYEPSLNVINLTKMKGAGSLAHEWGHAFDRWLGTRLGVSYASPYMAGLTPTEAYEKYGSSLAATVANLVSVMCTSPDGEDTTFYKDSKKFDELFRRRGGYWASTEEMFARAFSCYVQDRLESKGIRDDYLTGHSDTNQAERNGNIYCAYPLEGEREDINQAFDTLIAEAFGKN